MTDRITTVIAETLATNLWDRLTKGPRWIGSDEFPAVLNEEARNILAALKAARIAVVELPEPVISPRHQERIWEVGDSHVIFNEKWGDIRAELDYDNGDDDPLSASDAGAFAAALLAAKAAAEASQ